VCNCPKHTGSGFISHKATLVNALSRALADRVVLMDLTIGRKGLLGYLKALGGSNVVKLIPSNGSASGSQATDKRLRVICGANTSLSELQNYRKHYQECYPLPLLMTIALYYNASTSWQKRVS